MKSLLFGMLLFSPSIVLADELFDSTATAVEILQNSQYTTVGDANSCTLDDTPPSLKELLKKRVASAKTFSKVARVGCDQLTIYRDKNGNRRAIGYYMMGESTRPFSTSCDAGLSEDGCRKKLSSEFETSKKAGAERSLASLNKKEEIQLQPVFKAVQDNTYVAKPIVEFTIIPTNARLRGYTCPDGTLSAEQGDSWGMGGWEGRCGQTAATNLLYSLCGHLSNSLIKTGSCTKEESVFNDYTPGVHPSTMADDYNEFLKASGCTTRKVTRGNVSNSTVSEYLDGKVSLDAAMQKQAELVEKVVNKGKPHPTMFMIEVPGSKELHWVSLNNIYTDPKTKQKMVKVNHWGSQYDYPLSEMAKLTLKASWGSSGVGFAFGDLNYVQTAP